MMWLSGGFVFRRGDSVYHRLDPRVKLLASGLMFATTLLVKNVTELALVLGFMLGVAVVAKVLRRVGRTMVLTTTFSAFIFILNLFFTRNLETSALYAVRFVAIVVSTSLFFITTSPDELEQVMKTFRLPRDVVFAFVTAVRFIPVMMLDTIQIMDAQKSRGLELEKGNFLRRVRNMIPAKAMTESWVCTSVGCSSSRPPMPSRRSSRKPARGSAGSWWWAILSRMNLSGNATMMSVATSPKVIAMARATRSRWPPRLV